MDDFLSAPARFCLLLFLLNLPYARAQYVPSAATNATKWAPAQKPTMVGPINVGVILVLFPDTELRGGIVQFLSTLDNINGLSQEDYFKTYSNGITWPVVKLMPSEKEEDIYQAPQMYGYYCKFDFWSNPIGWHSTDEGQKREAQLKAEAMKHARSKSNLNFKPLAFCYITTRIADAAKRPNIRRYYAGHFGKKADDYPDPVSRPDAHPNQPASQPPELMQGDKPFDTWAWYQPHITWGEPMWPNSSIEFNNASAGTFAHEFGHVLGAPDLYRIGRPNDGISGTAALLAYGPTATAFSRYYHHGFVQEKNYPTITQSGTYTLYPRHINPENNESLGFIVPSRHPHYFYQIEYIYGENPALGSGGGEEGQSSKHSEQRSYFSVTEGILISVIDLRVSNYLGSPDLFYTYRPNDPYFRGLGNVNDCLFGATHDHTEFNMTTEPSSRLPNLLDGGVVFKNIAEHQGTATFDVEIDKTPLPLPIYQKSLLPQIKLEPIDQILPTSFRGTLTIKFRGEPLVDQYGMCWNTSKNPEVGHGTFTLSNCNGEIYQGRAINLLPNTTYYVRGWASNSKGTRYSEEELTVKTPPLPTDVEEVGPLLLDRFSNNSMLHNDFSNDLRDHYGAKTESYESYAPVAVLAKLAAYYHPDNLPAIHTSAGHNPNQSDTSGPNHELIVPADPNAGKTRSAINFGRLHWDPFESDPGWHKVETVALFEELRNQARASKMYGLTLTPEFMPGFTRIFKYKTEPQLVHVTSANLDSTLKVIENELINSRPVMVIDSPKPKTDNDKRIEWGLIDGFKTADSVHIDFPLDTEILKHPNERLNYVTLDSLLIKNYDLAVVIHISF